MHARTHARIHTHTKVETKRPCYRRRRRQGFWTKRMDCKHQQMVPYKFPVEECYKWKCIQHPTVHFYRWVESGLRSWQRKSHSWSSLKQNSSAGWLVSQSTQAHPLYETRHTSASGTPIRNSGPSSGTHRLT